MSKQYVPPPPTKRSGADTSSPRGGGISPRGGGSPPPPGSGAKKSFEEPAVAPVALSTGGGDEEVGGERETQMVTLETTKAPQEQDPREAKELLWEIKTHNFVLLLAGVLLGMGLGYVIWIFVRKDLVFWLCAIVGLVAAKVLEIKKFPQSLVRIWSAKETEEMLKPPVKWRETFGAGSEFFVQSDMYDIDKNYVRSTAVYHNRNTCALTIRERFVRRARLVNKLSMASPYGTVTIATIVLAISVGCYLNGADAGPNLSSAVTCFFVLFPVFILVGCIIELELRKRRLLAFASAQERVTYLPLHTIGKIGRQTYGGDHWKLLYTPPTADTKLRKIMKVLYILLVPFIVLFKFIAGIFMLATYNGAFAIWVWHCVATIVLYQAHVKKESEFVEPSMTLLWATFLVNIFEIWYCGPVNRCLDTCGTDPKAQLRKLELDADTRLPKDKVRKLVVGFCISLALVFISAVAMSSVTNEIFTNVEFIGVDKTWKQSYREHSHFILCKQNDDSTNGRRLLEEENISFASEFMIQPRSQTLRSKFSDDYDALCKGSTYRSMSVAVAFCTIDWFFLLFLALYWHRYDKYQTTMKYHDNNIVWFDFTVFTIHSIPSKITWIGRIIGRYKGDTSWFFMHPGDATKLYRYLTDHVPWYATLNPNQPGARELMPM